MAFPANSNVNRAQRGVYTHQHTVGDKVQMRLDTLLEPYYLGTYTAATIGVVLIYIISKLTRKRYKLAPGPFKLPIIGNVIQLCLSKLCAEENFYEMSKKYGPVVRANILGKEFIVLNDVNVVREAFVTKQDDFANRPVLWTGNLMSDGGKDILFGQPGPVWKYQRQLVHQAIRKYASGESIERICLGIFENVSELFKAETGPQVIKPITQYITYNLISGLTFGKQFTPHDEIFVTLKAMIKKNEEAMASGNPVDFMPCLVYCPLTWPKMNNITKTMKFFKQFIRDNIEESKNRVDNTIETLAGHIMAQQTEAGQVDVAKKNLISEVYLVNTTMNVFGAGIDTTNMTVQWFIGFMAKYPDIQKRLQMEIDEVYSPGVSLTDIRHKIPYVEAVLCEVMRVETVAPLGIPIVTGCDTSVGGYDIPKSCMVMPNIWALHNSADYWDEPELFNPDRFLNTDGSLKQRLPAFLPFGVGRRACIGEVISKSAMFMIITLLFHQYEFTVPEDDPDWSLIGSKVLIAKQPPTFMVVVKDRRQ